MADGPTLYDFQPVRRRTDVCYVQSDASTNESSDSENYSGLTHMDWCKCRDCMVMPTERGCVCCLEIKALNSLMDQVIGENMCITAHTDFSPVCLNRAVLRTY